MPDHPTVVHTDALQAAAEALRDLGADRIASCDDPLTVVRSLYAAVDALHDAWPALCKAARFDLHPDIDPDDDPVERVTRGLREASEGLWDASNAI